MSSTLPSHAPIIAKCNTRASQKFYWQTFMPKVFPYFAIRLELYCAAQIFGAPKRNNLERMHARAFCLAATSGTQSKRAQVKGSIGKTLCQKSLCLCTVAFWPMRPHQCRRCQNSAFQRKHVGMTCRAPYRTTGRHSLRRQRCSGAALAWSSVAKGYAQLCTCPVV